MSCSFTKGIKGSASQVVLLQKASRGSGRRTVFLKEGLKVQGRMSLFYTLLDLVCMGLVS